MNIQRHLRVAILMGVAGGMVGCKTTGGSFFGWGSGGSSTAVSAAPDVSKQKYEGLSQEFAGSPAKSTATTGLGGQKPEPQQNMFTAAWSKTTGAVSSVFASKPKVETPRDAISLDNKSKPLGADVYISAARLLENQNKLPEAVEKYEQALKLAPRDVNTLVSLARVHDRNGQPQKAVETYGRALAVEPQSSLVHNDLGLCFARQRDVPQSLIHLNKAVELQPANPKYRNNLASVLVEAGRVDDAYRQLASINPPAVAHYNLAYLLQQRGQNDVAVQHLQLALSADPNMAPAAAMLAQLRGPAVQTAQRPAAPVGPAAYGTPPLQIQSPAGQSPAAAPGSTPTSAPAASPFRRINHEEVVEDEAPAAPKVVVAIDDDAQSDVDLASIQPAADPVVLTISDESEAGPAEADDYDVETVDPSEPSLLPME